MNLYSNIFKFYFIKSYLPFPHVYEIHKGVGARWQPRASGAFCLFVWDTICPLIVLELHYIGQIAGM